MKTVSKLTSELTKKLFCNRLKELRAEKKWSQKEFAAILDCPSSTYANWEQGRREPSIFDIYNIIKVLEIQPNDLFDFDNL